MGIEIFLVLIITSVISFIGSLQPGPVNMAVIHTSLTGNQKQALSVVIGGVIPEVVYSIIALWFSFLFLANSWLNSAIHVVAIIFFSVAGVYLLRNKQPYKSKEVSSPKKHHFIFGLIAGLMNPMLFAFWLMVLAVYDSSGMFDMKDIRCQASFVTGSATGAFVLLWLAAWYSNRKKEAIYKILPAHPSRITGIVFIILALWEAMKMMILA